MIICDIFFLLILTFLHFSQVGKPILDTGYHASCGGLGVGGGRCNAGDGADPGVGGKELVDIFNNL